MRYLGELLTEATKSKAKKPKPGGRELNPTEERKRRLREVLQHHGAMSMFLMDKAIQHRDMGKYHEKRKEVLPAFLNAHIAEKSDELNSLYSKLTRHYHSSEFRPKRPEKSAKKDAKKSAKSVKKRSKR